MNRVDLKRQVLFDMVKAVSKLGTCKRARVGALIVRDGRVIATGYNGSPPDELHCLDIGCDMQDGHCVRTTHAEANAIAFAARHGIATAGATIYVYGWITGGDLGICPACNKLAKSAGIVNTVIVPFDQEEKKQEVDGIIHATQSKHDCQLMGCRVFSHNQERVPVCQLRSGPMMSVAFLVSL
jgi:dCMP deaminase